MNINLEILFVIVMFILGIFTMISRRIIDKLVIQTHKPVLDKSLIEAVNYSKQILGININNLQQLKIDDQNKFLEFAVGYMRMNYVKTLKELNIDAYDNDIICSLIIGSIKEK